LGSQKVVVINLVANREQDQLVGCVPRKIGRLKDIKAVDCCADKTGVDAEAATCITVARVFCQIQIVDAVGFIEISASANKIDANRVIDDWNTLA